MKQKAILAILAAGTLAAGVNAQQVDTVVVTNSIYEPMGVAAYGSYIYITASVSNRIVQYNPSTSVMDILAGSAQGTRGFSNAANGSLARFYNPQGITVARGGLVVSDSGNHVLRLVTWSGAVSTLAGVGTNDALVNGPAAAAKFNNPVGLDVDASGNIYIADAGNGAIRILFTNDTVATLATGFNQPYAVAVGNWGQVWVADTRNNVIKLIQTTGTGLAVTATSVTIVAGNISFTSGIGDADNALEAYFNNPRGLLWVGGNTGLLVSDTGNQVVRRVYTNSVSGGFSTTLVAGGYGEKGFLNGPPEAARFRSPVGLCRDNINGGFLIIDRENNALRRLQTSPPQPRIRNPRIGFVRIVDTPAGYAAKLFEVTQITFNDDEVLGIDPELGTQTYFTYGLTPEDPLDTSGIPDPGPGVGSTPPPFQDGQPTFPDNMLAPATDFIVKARSSAIGRMASEVVQARFIFQVAAPTMTGDNSAYVPVKNVTTGARMFYTTNGVDPVDGAGVQNFGPIFNGQALQLNVVATNLTVKMRAFRDHFKPSEVVTKNFEANNYSANKISFGFENGEASSTFIAAPGQRFIAPVTLSLLEKQKMYSLQFNILVTNVAGPPVNSSLTLFSSMLMKPVIDSLGNVQYVPIYPYYAGNNGDLTMLAWLERYGRTNLYNTLVHHLISYSRAHNRLYESEKTQRAIVGGYSLQIPPTAAPGSVYRIKLGRPSAVADGVEEEVFIDTPTNGPVTALKDITIGQRMYVVGDCMPFSWFNAGDFGDSNLLSSDLMQVFQTAVYALNAPDITTDFYNAMDSCCWDTNGVNQATLFTPNNALDIVIDKIAVGDTNLAINDLFVTLRRALDPNRVWYARYWPTNAPTGMRAYQVVPNQYRGTTGADELAIKYTINTDAGTPGVRIIAGDVEQAAAGATLQIPITAEISGGMPLRIFWLRVSVDALDGSPAITEPIQFIPAPEIGAPTLVTNRSPADFAGCWLNLGQGIVGTNALGTLVVQLPAGATVDSGYVVRIGSFSGSPNGLGLYPHTTADGLITFADRSRSYFNDGIPDSWRLRYFNTVNNQLSHALADADGDGVPNWMEYRAGTHPNDAASRLKLLASRVRVSGERFVLRWPTVANKRYVIEAADNPASQNWTVVAPNVAGDGFMKEFQETEPTTAKRFYRVRLLE